MKSFLFPTLEYRSLIIACIFLSTKCQKKASFSHLNVDQLRETKKVIIDFRLFVSLEK